MRMIVAAAVILVGMAIVRKGTSVSS